ncbi:MAG: ABC transporter ATP-binding protein [Acidimicrobiaceae bacterium]|nr:ABC transporter ATP-binding protein [Acidimicrobiaceae bacterium]
MGAVDNGCLLEIKDIRKSFEGDKGKRNLILDDISLQVCKGEFVSILGASGCGKTTLLRIIDGLIESDSGEVILEGERVGPAQRRRMAFVFQDSNLLPWRSVQKNVELNLEAMKELSKAQRSERAIEALRLVGLEEVASRPPYQLSGGMQQRVGVARALARQPVVFLMDEPFGHLDNFTRERLQQEMSRLIERIGATVVFVTHDIDEAILLSDKIVLMRSNPGQVSRVLSVDLPRPRWKYNVRAHPTALALRESIVEELGLRIDDWEEVGGIQ